MNHEIKLHEIKLIVGLANPGKEYEHTRHNAGAWYLDALANRYNLTLKPEAKFFGLTAKGLIAGKEVRLLIPTTFMNLSGKAVSALANFYNIEAESILVAHDELDIAPGTAKLKRGGSNGGHNGLKDIQIKMSNNANFLRLRIGIGHPGDKNKVTGFVLSKPPEAEYRLIEDTILEALNCTEILLKENLTLSVNRLHSFNANAK